MTSFAPTPRIAMVGTGGIGGVIAWSLAKAGLSPTLIARGESARTIARDGLTVERTGSMVPAGEPMSGPESVRLFAPQNRSCSTRPAAPAGHTSPVAPSRDSRTSPF